MKIIYCVDNKLGGVSSLNYNLIANNPFKENIQCLFKIDCEEWIGFAKSDIIFPVEESVYFKYSIYENYYCILKKLYQQIPKQAGAIVVNYYNEMAMLDQYKVQQTIYQLVHDNYNLTLAQKYGHIVDVFICHNSIIYQQLLEKFSSRKADIFFLPHGVRIPFKHRTPSTIKKKIQLVFLGRMVETKGIFDLPIISKFLKEKEIDFEWTCIGNGPDLERLKKTWCHSDAVTFLSPSSNEEVMNICADKDVFVLPTKFEGSPVSLIETMSAGLVPVISDLPGGITDIVNETIGFKVQLNDNEGFANAIAKLYQDRNLLNTLSNNCRNRIIDEYDVKNTSMEYHKLFSKYAFFYKPKQLKKLKVGSSLDQPFLPNFVTKKIRKIWNKQSKFQ